MNRIWSSLRRPHVLSSSSYSSSSLRRQPFLFPPLPLPVASTVIKPISTGGPLLHRRTLGFQDPLFSWGFDRSRHNTGVFGSDLLQVRHYKSKAVRYKERKKKALSRAPTTPIVSKVKKYKIKPYSSFKSRFRTLNDGTIRRWRAGKRHNAHLKSKISKRRLRKPEIVHAAYAKVMKKLNFCG